MPECGESLYINKNLKNIRYLSYQRVGGRLDRELTDNGEVSRC